VVANTGPIKPAPMRAALITPIAEPPACWTTRETTSGKTGAIDSTCTKRSPPYGHTEPASASAATERDEVIRSVPISLRSGKSSPRRGTASAPSAAATPETKIRTPPTSSVRSASIPSPGRTCGRIEVK
jgi:hypothetical protein